jgi:hypothetical protein
LAVDTRIKAVRIAIITVAGTVQTALVSYFINRDMFPSIIKLLQDTDSAEVHWHISVLLGLLLNYQKGEFLSPYRTRLEDFVNKDVIDGIATSCGTLCGEIRDEFAAIQEDQLEGWGVGGALSWFGFGRLASVAQPAPVVLTEEQQTAAFNAL